MSITAAVAAASALAVAQQDTTVRDTIVLLEGMVVNATRGGETPRIDRALSLSLTTPRLSQRASGTVAAHLLRDVAGVYVQQTSAGQASVTLRGLLGNQVLMLVNGVPMNNGTYRDGPGQYLATIDPETVERIEVIRGPASVLYGSDAQGGVVNILTRPHPTTLPTGIRVASAASSADRSYRARVSAGLVGERVSVAVGGTFASAGDLRAGGGLGPQTPTGFTAEGLDAEVRYRTDGRHELVAAVQHLAMHDVPRYDRYVTFRDTTGIPGRDAEHVFQPQTRQLAYARYAFTPRRPWLTRLEVTASLAAQREGRHQVRLLDTGEPDDTRTSWRDDVLTPGVSLVGSSILAVWSQPVLLTWGSEFYHDVLASEGFEESRSTGVRVPLVLQTATGTIPTGNFPDGATADRFGAFLAAEADIAAALKLSAGARWSWFRNAADVGVDFGGAVDNASSDLTLQLGLVAIPARAWRVAVRVAEGFRAPNLYDLTRTGPVPGGVALPNPDAAPERSISGEVAVRLGTRRTALEVTGYVTRIRNFIDRVPGTFAGDTLFGGERVFQGRNVGTARVRGLEAEAVQAAGPWRFRATALYTHGEQETPAAGDEPMSKIPPFGGTASVRWTPSWPAVWIEYVFRWATPQNRLGTRDLSDPRILPGGSPGYAVHGVRAGATVASELDLSAGFENLTDELYRSHASGVDHAGRHVWVGLSWTRGF